MLQSSASISFSDRLRASSPRRDIEQRLPRRANQSLSTPAINWTCRLLRGLVGDRSISERQLQIVKGLS